MQGRLFVTSVLPSPIEITLSGDVMVDEKDELEMLCHRIDSLEHQVTVLVQLVERATGMWVFIKWFGAASVGFTALFAFLTNHLTLK